MTEQRPLPTLTAWSGVARCVVAAVRLLAARRIHQPQSLVGRRLAFADGTESWVYRETVVDRSTPTDPVVLVVAFRLRGVRGHGHTLFRAESRLNTPLFVGFPGFVSKLWLAHDTNGLYRGVYEWESPQLAEDYARSLWRVLALVSVRGSIRYHIVPQLTREGFLGQPEPIPAGGSGEWWRVSRPTPVVAQH